ncbi:autophagy-related 17 isoform X3 [Lasioglossum baleicum]|uniref:autophagy-related 17 isoform X3 n=1 Tax=Lasioglossum baleicum TaxID=434251 RepID=UPI003FCE7C7B
MLYIFRVDTGTTITFDIKLALQPVSELMEAIERECGVVATHQVLLMSGGESLKPDARVCSYSAGTDTNPIYLFSKAAIQDQTPPKPSIDYGSDIDLQCQIDSSLAMPATYQTLVARAQLAQQCCMLAGEQTRICEKLVHDQHLQQQGWAAVVANLEDITQMFQSRAAVHQQSFALYLSEREQHMELLQNFNADLGMLAKIPILPALRAQAEGLLSPDDQPIQTEKDANGQEEVFSLLSWISAKDNQSSLEQVAEQCSRGLEQFNEKLFNDVLKIEVSAAIFTASKQDMKKIKGLGERLFALEQLMQQTKRLVQEQGELAQGFLQNQSRASNLGDASVLPDLCTSHRRQLLVMLENHNQLRDIRRRCTKSKEELSVNIYQRLKWVMYVENKMREVDSKLMMYNESLKRLRRHLEVFQQIHLAPQMYMNAVAEVVRRRTFSQAFLVWASNLACQLLTVHSEELARRREFQSKFDGHFLNTLFPGLEDTPPPFATQAPSVFDGGLPNLTVDDMEVLRSQLPDLALTVSSPDLNSITQFFLSKSLTDASTDGNKEKDSSSMRVDDVPAKEQEGARAPMLSDRGDFESETDTEEFEKIGQGATDSKPESFDGAKQMRQKQLEENLGNTREEVERLRSILKTMKAVVSEAMSSVRQELTVLRDQSSEDKSGLREMTERVREALALYSSEYDRPLREREQELKVGHELEMADAKKVIQSHEEEICSLKRIVLEKETELSEHERLMTTMRQKLESEQTEMRNLRTRLHQQLNEALEQACVVKKAAAKEANNDRFREITTLANSVSQCQETIQELRLSTASTDQQRLVDATDMLPMVYKDDLVTTRVQMNDIVMDGSSSDSCVYNITASMQHVLRIAVQIIEERAASMEKMDQELKMARQVMEEKEQEVKMYKMREFALLEELEQYKTTIRRVTKSEEFKNVPEEMSVSQMREVLKGLRAEKDEVDVSESKKVRVEANDDQSCLSRRMEMLENDNKRLNSEMQALREYRESAKTKIEALKAEKIRLEVELVKERSRRSFAARESSEGREKEMIASVAVVSEGSSRDAATSPEPQCCMCMAHCGYVRKKMKKTAEKLVQQRRITVTSCDPGDKVLVFWNPTHENFTLYQESPIFYFLNTDCVAALDLGPTSDGLPKRQQTIAEVVDKEYCQAKKSENRFRVPRGTKFYRVRVKSLKNISKSIREDSHSFSYHSEVLRDD